MGRAAKQALILWGGTLAVLATGPALADRPLVGVVHVGSKRIKAPWPVGRKNHPPSFVTLGNSPMIVEAARPVYDAGWAANTRAHVVFATPSHLVGALKSLLEQHRIGEHTVIETRGSSAIEKAAHHVTQTFGPSTPLAVLRAQHHLTGRKQIAKALLGAWESLGSKPNQPILIGAQGSHSMDAAMLVGPARGIAAAAAGTCCHPRMDPLSERSFDESVRIRPIDSFEAIGRILEATLNQPHLNRQNPDLIRQIVGSKELVEGGRIFADGRSRDSLLFGDTTHERRHGGGAQTVVVLNGIEYVSVLRSGPGLLIAGGRPTPVHELLVPFEVQGGGVSTTMWIDRKHPSAARTKSANVGNSVSIADAGLLKRVDLLDTPPLNVVETVSQAPHGGWQRIVYVEAKGAGIADPQRFVDGEHLGDLNLR